MKPSRTGPFRNIPVTERPKLEWPHGARVALWVIPNIEVFPLDQPVPMGSGRTPDVPAWSVR